MPSPDNAPGRGPQGPIGIQTNEAVTPTPAGRLPDRLSNAAPPIAIPQGRRRTGEGSPWLKRIALTTVGTVAIAGGGYILRNSFTTGDGGASPTPIVTPEGSPTPPITPSPEPTPSATPTEVPSASPTGTPDRPTPIPTPSDPVWQEWNATEITTPWLDNNGSPERFGLSPGTPGDLRRRSAQTEIVEVENPGNTTVVIMGAQDNAGNRVTIAVGLPSDRNTQIGFLDSNRSDAGGLGQPKLVEGSKIYEEMNKYLFDISKFEFVLDADFLPDEVKRADPDLYNFYKRQEEAAREVVAFLEAIQTVDYRTLDHIPPSVNTSQVDPSQIPYIKSIGIFKVPGITASGIFNKPEQVAYTESERRLLTTLAKPQ